MAVTSQRMQNKFSAFDPLADLQPSHVCLGWRRSSLAFPLFCLSTGNIWLCLLVERVPGEVPDSHKLPPPNPALPSHWRAAQPSHTERGGTQPLWGPFCSGPHGRLNGWHTSSVWNSFSSSALQLLFLFFFSTSPFFFFFVKWPLCTRDDWDKILNLEKKRKKSKTEYNHPASSPCLVVFTGFPNSLESLEFYQIKYSWGPPLNSSFVSVWTMQFVSRLMCSLRVFTFFTVGYCCGIRPCTCVEIVVQNRSYLWGKGESKYGFLGLDESLCFLFWLCFKTFFPSLFSHLNPCFFRRQTNERSFQTRAALCFATNPFW